MKSSQSFSIKSTITFHFSNDSLRDYSYNAYSPEFQFSSFDRSHIEMQKQPKSLTFSIESSDITAFRATVSDIISLGKVVESTLNLCE